MTKYYDVLIDGEFDKGFKNSQKKDAEIYYSKESRNAEKDVKLVLHWRKVLKHSKAIV